MTIRPLLAATAALAAAAAVPASGVDLTLSSPDDLSMLSPGQTFTVNVNLGDLDAGQELATLDAIVFAPGDALSPAGGGDFGDVAPGPIVPDPDLTFVGDLSEADDELSAVGSFTALDAGIDQAGTFFSFDLTADALGSGTIRITTALAEDFAFDPVDVTVGDGLAFAVVPEPATLGLVAAAPALLLRRR